MSMEFENACEICHKPCGRNSLCLQCESDMFAPVWGTVCWISIQSVLEQLGYEKPESKQTTKTLDCGCSVTKGWRCPVHGQP
jgi:hypothetical protein